MRTVILSLIGACVGGLCVWCFKPAVVASSEALAPPQPQNGNANPPKASAPAKIIDPLVLELKAKLLPMLASSSEEARSAVMLKEFATITPENALLYQSAWREVAAADPNGNALWGALNRRLGQLVGPEVVGKRTGESGRDKAGAKSYVKDQLLGWMESDPQAARMWFQNLKPSAFQTELLASCVKDLEDGKINQGLVP